MLVLLLRTKEVVGDEASSSPGIPDRVRMKKKRKKKIKKTERDRATGH